MVHENSIVQIEDYIASLMPERPAALAELERHAYLRGLPLLGPNQGQFLCMLAQSIGAREALEVGTATGYAALWLLQAVAPAGGRLTAVEQQPDRYRLAREFIAKAGYNDNFTMHEGHWSQVLPTLSGPYDFIFLDVLRSAANDREAVHALDLCVPLLRPGGLLIGDNVLCSSQVLEDDAPPIVRGIQHFNRTIMRHPDLESVIIPLRDGVSISRKKG
jgi:predicted O-methyltransferase YrrM